MGRADVETVEEADAAADEASEETL
jgi:hypothetical protein